MSRRFENALITGAASGIGQSLCQLAVSHGTSVCAVDRDFSNASTKSIDKLSINVTSPAFLNVLTASLAKPIDLVVHCAAISAVGRFENITTDDHESVLRINLLAPIRITQELIAKSLVTGDATHVFVASMSCFTGYPGASTYAASKDGLRAFARCLQESVRHSGGNVVTAFPGPTNTPHAIRYSPNNSRSAHRTHPDAVALAIWHAANKGQAATLIEPVNRIGAVASTLFPSTVAKLMGKWLLPTLDNTGSTYTDRSARDGS